MRKNLLPVYFFVGILSLSFLFILTLPVRAEKFPTRPVSLIVPFGPGSGTDLVARAIQPYIKKTLGVPLMIENVPGADSRIGLAKLQKALPDGYTIGIHGYPAPLIAEILFGLPFKTSEFSFIYAWTTNPMVIFVAEGTYRNFQEFTAEAQRRTLTIGMPGLGTVSHLIALIIEKHLGVKFNYIPYPGSAQALASLAGRHVEAAFSSTDAALSLVQAKKLRPILVCSYQPDPNFPEVPLTHKLNIPTVVMTRGVFGPPKMPKDRIAILEKAFATAAREPKLVEWIKSRGMGYVSLSGDEFRKEVEKQQRMLQDFEDILRGSLKKE